MRVQTFLALLPLLAAAAPLAAPQDAPLEKMPGAYPKPPQCWIDAKCEWDPFTGQSWYDLPVLVAEKDRECFARHTCDKHGGRFTLEHPAPCSHSGWCDYLGNRISPGKDAHIGIPTSA